MYSYPGAPPGQHNPQLPLGAIPPGTATGVPPSSNNQGFNYGQRPPQLQQQAPTYYAQPPPPFQYQPPQQPPPFQQRPQYYQQQQQQQQVPPPPPPPPPTSPPLHQHQQWGAPSPGFYNPSAPPPSGPQGNSGVGYNPGGHPIIHGQYAPQNMYGSHATGQPAPPPPGQQPPPPPPPPPPTQSPQQYQQPFGQQQYYGQQQHIPPPPPPNGPYWGGNAGQQFQTQQSPYQQQEQLRIQEQQKEQQRLQEQEQQRLREQEEQRIREEQEREKKRLHEEEQKKLREEQERRLREEEEKRRREEEERRLREEEERRRREEEEKRQREEEEKRRREEEEEERRRIQQQEEQRLRELEEQRLRELEQQRIREQEEIRLKEQEAQRLREQEEERVRLERQQQEQQRQQQQQFGGYYLNQQQYRPPNQFGNPLNPPYGAVSTPPPPPIQQMGPSSGSAYGRFYQPISTSTPPPPPSQPPLSAVTSHPHQQNRPTASPVSQFQPQLSQQIYTSTSTPPQLQTPFQSEPPKPSYPSEQGVSSYSFVIPLQPSGSQVVPPALSNTPLLSQQTYTTSTATPPSAVQQQPPPPPVQPPPPQDYQYSPVPPPIPAKVPDASTQPQQPAAPPPKQEPLVSSSVFGHLDEWDTFGGYFPSISQEVKPPAPEAPKDTPPAQCGFAPYGVADGVAQPVQGAPVNPPPQQPPAIITLGSNIGSSIPQASQHPADPAGYGVSPQIPRQDQSEPVAPPGAWPDQSAPVNPPTETRLAPAVNGAVSVTPSEEPSAPAEPTEGQLTEEQARLSEEDATIERLQELDVFYQDSITRFIVMIEEEAAAESDVDKLRIFQEFMENEYYLRGKKYPMALRAVVSRNPSNADQHIPVLPPANNSESLQPPVTQPFFPHYTLPETHIVSPLATPPESTVRASAQRATHNEPVQTAPVASPKPATPINQQTAPVVPQEPIYSEPLVYNQPLQTEPQPPAPTKTPVQTAPVYTEPSYQQLNDSIERVNDEYPQENQPQTPKPTTPAPAAAGYKPFRPTTVPPVETKPPPPTQSPVYARPSPPQSPPPFVRPDTPQSPPMSPKAESSKAPAKPAYVPYKPATFQPPPRRNSFDGGEPASLSHGFSDFHHHSTTKSMARSEFGSLRRAETSIANMSPGFRPNFTKDETFLPMKDPAADNFFPSFSEEDIPYEEPAPPPPPAKPVSIVDNLVAILPPKGAKREKSQVLNDIKERLTAIGEDFSFIDKLSAAFEKKEGPARRQLEEDRRARQEEHQDYIDRLFAENEIGYGDIGDMDDEFNKREEKQREKEEKDEYNRYTKEVFDPVYNQLQEGIKEIMELHFRTGGELLMVAVAGSDRWAAEGRPEYEAVLQMLVRLDGMAERRHAKVHEAIIARDRKFRKTVTEPLRAVNDTKKVMAMIKHFDESEKKLTLDTVQQKLHRTQTLMATVQAAVETALDADVDYIGHITAEINHILSALPGPPSAYTGDHVQLHKALMHAHATIKSCMQAAENLMKVFHVGTLVLNAALHEVALAQARLEGKEESPLEEKARILDEEADAELKERVKGLEEYAVVVGNIEMVAEGLKLADVPAPAAAAVQPLKFAKRAATAVASPPVSPGTPAPASALERARMRNHGGNVIPYE